jgi:TatD DNase family protein
MFFDSHCHLTDPKYNDKDLELILKKIQEDNIFCISMATDLNEIEKLEILSSNKNVYFGFGIHPYEAHKYYPISKYQDLLKNSFLKYKQNQKLIFIGEVGIDLYNQIETKNQQIEVFEYFVYLASEYNFPLSIHTRSAENEVINILKKYELKKHIKAVFHCFVSDSKDILKEILKNNWYIGVGGVITFKNKKNDYLREILLNIDLTNVLLETDSPYLTPEPYRGKINYPFHVKIIYEYISNLRKIDLEDLKQTIFNNLKKITDNF